jgi:V8-like Glu-specific endopeptidase
MEALRALYQQDVSAEALGPEEYGPDVAAEAMFLAGPESMEAAGIGQHAQTTNDDARAEFVEAESPEFGDLGAPDGPTIHEVGTESAGAGDESAGPESAGAGDESAGPVTALGEEYLLDAWYAEYGDPITRAALRQPEVAAGIMEVVIGDDDRRQVTQITKSYPWRCICSLLITDNDGNKWIGTGWLIGPRTVITAGHCVYIHRRGGWVRSIEVIPGRDGSARPFGSCVATSFRSVTGWTENRDRNYDYAAILLPENCRYGDQLGWFGFANFTDATLAGFRVNLSGYPGDKPPGTQWFHSRKLKGINAQTLVYDIDTAGGQSGAPVWAFRNGQRHGVGIHTNGHVSGNSATRINAAVYQNLINWKQAGS